MNPIAGPTRTTETGTGPDMLPKGSPNPGSVLDKNDFLKLFVAQMVHQDPSKPMDNGEMMGQMASFSTLEQISNMAAANEAVAASLHQGQAIGLIGRTVTWVDDAGAEHSGVVDKVSTRDGASILTVGDEEVDPSMIVAVA